MRGHFLFCLSPVPSTELVAGCRSRDTASTTAIHERTGRLDGIQNRSVGAQRHCCRLFLSETNELREGARICGHPIPAQTDPTRTWGGKGGATLPSSRFLESLGEAPTHHPSSFPATALSSSLFHCCPLPSTNCPGPGPGLRAARRPSAFRRRSLHSSSLLPRLVPFPPSTHIHPETTHRQTRRLSWSSSPPRRAHCPRPCPSTSSAVFDSVPTRGSFFGSLCVFVLPFPDPAFPSE